MKPVAKPPLALLGLADRQGGLVSATQCGDVGVGAHWRARLVKSGEWKHASHGVYDLGPAAVSDPEQRRRRAAWLGLLAFGPGAVAVGQSALALHGIKGLPTDIVSEVALPRGTQGRSRDGVRVRQYRPTPTHKMGEGRVVTVVTALVQALPELPRNNAVAVLDDVLHRRLVTDDDCAALRSQLIGRRGAARAAGWWRLVDRRAESPLETFARLECVDAGIPPDELQVEIRSDDGRLLGRGDMGWHIDDDRWLIAEIDGREFHEMPDALLRDRSRQNALIASGRVEVLRFTAADIARRGTLPSAVRQALAGLGADASRRA